MAMVADSTGRQRIERFRRLVHETTGIRMPASKELMIESRLRKRLVALGLPDLQAYLRHIFEEGGLDAELPRIVDLLTTNKTDFFREIAHYRLLEQRLIPEALASARAGRPVPFRVWSAAASNGSEAWSAAMLLARAAAADRRLDWAILGTDISRRMLATARRAVYPAADLAPVPPDLRAAYAMSGRSEAGAPLCRIVPELRARVRFAALNLIETPYAVDGGLDVIFLRNVLIYFDPDLQARIIASASAHLRPGGHLIVGHSESMTVRQPGLAQVAPGVFRNGGEG